MGKIETLSEHIAECTNFNGSNEEAKALVTRIKGIYYNDIPNIDMMLDNDYDYQQNYLGAFTEYVDRTNYKSHVAILRDKLKNYRDNLELEETQSERALELARLKQPTMTQTTNVSVNVTIEQTIKQIDDVPNTSLSEADKTTLKEYLYSLEGIKAAKDKPKFWDKAKDVLKFLADKGADAAIAALPMIIQGLQAL